MIRKSIPHKILASKYAVSPIRDRKMNDVLYELSKWCEIRRLADSGTAKVVIFYLDNTVVIIAVILPEDTSKLLVCKLVGLLEFGVLSKGIILVGLKPISHIGLCRHRDILGI